MLQCIKKEEYDKAIIMVKDIEIPIVQDIMFDSKCSAEYKAALIINLMKKKI